jgi:hypothetical protein
LTVDPIAMAVIVLVRTVVLPALGIFAGGFLLAKTPAGRRLIDAVTARTGSPEALRDMQEQLDQLRYQLDETQERLDAAERMLASPRPRLGPGNRPRVEPITPV